MNSVNPHVGQSSYLKLIFSDDVKSIRIGRNFTLEDIAQTLATLRSNRHGPPLAISVIFERGVAHP